MADEIAVEEVVVTAEDGDKPSGPATIKKPFDKHDSANDKMIRVWRYWALRNRKTLIALLLLFTVLLGGAGVFQRLEQSQPPYVMGSRYIQPNETWTYLNSVYFCVVVVATIGFGDMEPHSLGGQIFFYFFAIIGIGTAAITVTTLPNFIGSLIKGCTRRLRPVKGAQHLLTAFQRIAVYAIGWCLYAICGAAIFAHLEGWGVTDATYFVIVSLTAIGFGDLVPVTSSGRLFFIFYALFGVGYTIVNISNVADQVFSASKQASKDAQNDLQLCGGGPRAFVKRNYIPLLATVVLVAFLMFGALGFAGLEGGLLYVPCPLSTPSAEQANCTALDNGYLPFAWTFGNSLYFCLTMLTTIGYGDMTPRTYGGRVFTCLYCVSGLIVMTLVVSTLASTVFQYWGSQMERTLHQFENACCRRSPDNKKRKLPARYKLLAGFSVFAVYIIAFAPVFGVLENWPFQQSVWFCFVTMGTIGFGNDLVPVTHAGRIFWVFYTLTGIFFVAFLMSYVARRMVSKFDKAAAGMGLVRKKLAHAYRSRTASRLSLRLNSSADLNLPPRKDSGSPASLPSAATTTTATPLSPLMLSRTSSLFSSSALLSSSGSVQRLNVGDWAVSPPVLLPPAQLSRREETKQRSHSNSNSGSGDVELMSPPMGVEQLRRLRELSRERSQSPSGRASQSPVTRPSDEDMRL